MYANTFEPYRQFYQENESLDLEAIREGEHGIVIMALMYTVAWEQALRGKPPSPSPHPCSHESPKVACSQAVHQ